MRALASNAANAGSGHRRARRRNFDNATEDVQGNATQRNTNATETLRHSERHFTRYGHRLHARSTQATANATPFYDTLNVMDYS